MDDNLNGIVSYDYDDYGVTEKRGDEGFLNEICYTGGIYDDSTSLYYLNARYYDPSTGRFLSEDTYRGEPADANTWHLYVYCANNPVNYVDPSGHYWVKFSSIKKRNDRNKQVIMKRYNENKKYYVSSYINNQNYNKFTKMKFGAHNVDYNGCGPIAAYNLLIMLGKKRNFAQILAEFDYNCAGGKNFGVSMGSIKNFLKSNKVSSKQYYTVNKMQSNLKKAGILKVQWGYGGQHYTAIKKSGKRYLAYNTGSGSVIISEKNIRNILIRMNGTIITGIAFK